MLGALAKQGKVSPKNLGAANSVLLSVFSYGISSWCFGCWQGATGLAEPVGRACDTNLNLELRCPSIRRGFQGQDSCMMHVVACILPGRQTHCMVLFVRSGQNQPGLAYATFDCTRPGSGAGYFWIMLCMARIC
jgi:hypothetical protein